MDISELPQEIQDMIKSHYFEIIRQRARKLFRIIDHLGFLDSVNYHDDVRSCFLHHRRQLLGCLDNYDGIRILIKLHSAGRFASKWISQTEAYFNNVPEKKSVINLISFLYAHIPLLIQSSKLDDYPNDLNNYTCHEIQMMAYEFLQ